MSDLKQELCGFEGSDALGVGDFSVCLRAAARIAELEAMLERLMGPPPDKIKLRTGMMAAGVSEKTADQILSSPTFNRAETIEKPIMSSMSTKPMENINEQQD